MHCARRSDESSLFAYLTGFISIAITWTLVVLVGRGRHSKVVLMLYGFN